VKRALTRKYNQHSGVNKTLTGLPNLFLFCKSQATDTVEHKVRNVILEVLNRMPHSETLKPYVVDLMKLSMHVAATDNEENALIALRIIFDLHKNYRPNLEDEVQPFLDFVVKVSGVSRFHVVDTGGFGVASDRRTRSSRS
jgi:hypothetical protein